MTSNLRINIHRYIIVRNYIESKNMKHQYTGNIGELRKRLMSQIDTVKE